MNERIKTLAMRLSTDVEYREDIPWNDPRQAVTHYWFSIDDLDKFVAAITQDIVKECAGIYDAIDNGNPVHGTDDYLKALAAHFELKRNV